MQFRTIVKDPKALEQYFSPLFLNLKDGECLEDYRQNQEVDDFLNAIPKSYEVEDLRAFYEKTGIKVEHQKFKGYWFYQACNPSGKMPDIDESELIEIEEMTKEMTEEKMKKRLADYPLDRAGIAIELREGYWDSWCIWEELQQRVDEIKAKYEWDMQQQTFIKKMKWYKVGKFTENNCYVVLIKKGYEEEVIRLRISNLEYPETVICTVRLQNYETPEIDELYSEIQNWRGGAVWKKRWLRSMEEELKEYRDYLEKEKKNRIIEYLEWNLKQMFCGRDGEKTGDSNDYLDLMKPYF